MTTPLHPFILRVEELLKSEGISQRILAQRGNIPRHEVNAIMNGAEPTYRFCMAVAKVFNEPCVLVLHEAGLLPVISDSLEEQRIKSHLDALLEYRNNDKRILVSNSFTTRVLRGQFSSEILKYISFTSTKCDLSVGK